MQRYSIALFEIIFRELETKHDKLADELFNDYRKINDPEIKSSLVSHNEMIHFLNSGSMLKVSFSKATGNIDDIKYELLDHARDNFFNRLSFKDSSLSAQAVSDEFESSLEQLRLDMLKIGCLFKPSDTYGFGNLKFKDRDEAKKVAKASLERYLHEKLPNTKGKGDFVNMRKIGGYPSDPSWL